MVVSRHELRCTSHSCPEWGRKWDSPRKPIPNWPGPEGTWMELLEVQHRAQAQQWSWCDHIWSLPQGTEGAGQSVTPSYLVLPAKGSDPGLACSSSQMATNGQQD